MLDPEHACLTQLYRSLRPTEQQVMLLRYAEGLSHDEIAEVLELHPDTIEVLLSRVRVLARKLLDGQPSRDLTPIVPAVAPPAPAAPTPSDPDAKRVAG